MRILTVIFCLTLGMLLGSKVGAYADKPWSALKSGNHFVLIRHALAPGYSDPDYFDVEENDKIFDPFPILTFFPINTFG